MTAYKLAVIVPQCSVDAVMSKWNYCKTLISAAKRQLSMVWNWYDGFASFFQCFLGTPAVYSHTTLSRTCVYTQTRKICWIILIWLLLPWSGLFSKHLQSTRTSIQEPAYKTWWGIDEHYRLIHLRNDEKITKEQWCHAVHHHLENFYIDVHGNELPPPEPNRIVDELERRRIYRLVDVHPILIDINSPSTTNQEHTQLTLQPHLHDVIHPLWMIWMAKSTISHDST